MPLAIGDLAPDFEAEAHDGSRLHLADLRNRKRVVLYFYPKDFSFFCSKEACGLRDIMLDGAAREAVIVGVSRDSLERHRAFAKAHALVFPLVSDERLQLATKYRATSVVGKSVFGMANRVTYVIDRRGFIAGVIEGELSAKKHVDGVRAILPRIP
jgi:peroxiredoxin Q/BCP